MVRIVRVGLVRPTVHGVDGCGVPNNWITGIQRWTGNTAQGHKPRSDTLRSTGVEGREAGKQGHGATLGQCPRSLRWPTLPAVDNRGGWG